MTANELDAIRRTLTEREHRDAIRWELARRLEGMREPAHHDHNSRWEPGDAGSDDYRQIYLSCAEVGCPGYKPVSLTAEGLLDEGRLRRAIEEAGCTVERKTNRKWYVYPPFNLGIHTAVGNPILAIAYLTAVGAWPVKEAPHD